MLTIAFNFPAGRYHATPWGRHVNEADVGWPPDLWRLSRALIATWHRKLDPAEFPRERLIDLLSALAAEPPHYRLPDAVHFHTRHYMPVRDKPSLIFDAFAQVGREAELIAHWPTITLDAPQTGLLDALLSVMGYLGRAESWVEARRVEGCPGECKCRPSEEAIDAETGEAGDLVQLRLPCTASDYAAFRQQSLDVVMARNLSPRGIKTIRSTLPEDWLDAISLDTGQLQSAGWSDPPAARKLYYRRPKDALRFMAATPARQVVPEKTVTTARFALYAKPLPRITDAVRVGENLRIAAMGLARRLFGDGIPACISGHDLPAGNRHGHAFFLCEANEAGRVDHVVIHAPDGFDARAQRVLSDLKSIFTRDGAEWRLLLQGMDEPKEFPGALLAQGSCWESVTPYLHPWHRKKGFDVVEQIARECRLRGLTEPVLVESIPETKSRALEFRRFRAKRGLQQPDRQGHFLRLVFPIPVAGPLALGFGCHFGLGLFAAK